MGFLGKLTGSGKTRDQCKQDLTTGAVSCKRFRMNKDGTEVEIGAIHFQKGGDCEIHLVDQNESEPGVIQDLDAKYASKIQAKCRREPSSRPPADY